MPSFKPVVALARGLEVLRTVNELDRPTVGNIHKATKLDKATIVRLLETLMEQGYLVALGDGPCYVPTGKVKQLSVGFDNREEMGRKGLPVLERYRDRLIWPATLASFDGDAMVLAGASKVQSGIDVVRRAGYRFPILRTSPGLAYFANLESEERVNLLEHLRNVPDPAGWNAPAHDPEALEVLVQEIRSRGYALADPQYLKSVFDDTLWGMSVPIIGRNGLHGTVGLMVLRQIQPVYEGVTKLFPALRALGNELAEVLDV